MMPVCFFLFSLPLQRFRAIPKMVIRQFDHYTGETQNTNQVRNCHQSVKRVCDFPCKAQIHGRTNNDNNKEENLERTDTAAAKQIF